MTTKADIILYELNEGKISLNMAIEKTGDIYKEYLHHKTSDNLFRQLNLTGLSNKLLKMYDDILKSSDKIVPKMLEDLKSQINKASEGIINYGERNCSNYELGNIKEKLSKFEF